jgi:hypothetical protein
MELEELLRTKIYVKENSAMAFDSPTAYLNPFIDRLESFNPTWEVDTSKGILNANDDVENTINAAYPRVVLKAKLPQYQLFAGQHDMHSEMEVGLLYALDLQKPIMKLYMGSRVRVCTNMSIFNPMHVTQQDFSGNITELYNKAAEYADIAERVQREHETTITRLKETLLTTTQVNESLGHLLRNGSRLFGVTPITNAAKELSDRSSRYYMGGSSTSAWNLFNAVTEGISNKSDLIEVPSKSINFSKFFLDHIQAN